MTWFNLFVAFLKLVWKKWLAIAHVIGNFQSQVILSLFYLIIILPLGVAFRLFADPLRLRSGQALISFSKKKKLTSNFLKWEHPKENIEQARKQF